MMRLGTVFAVVMLCQLTWTSCSANIEDLTDDDPTYNDLNQEVSSNIGHCPAPQACRTRCWNDSTSMKCTFSELGPYLLFTSYDLKPRLWSFNFSNNFIMYLDEFAFYTNNFRPVNLSSVVLSHNIIKTIHPNTFAGDVGKQLTTIDLSHNEIEEINPGTFDSLPALVTLNLAHNKISSIDNIYNVHMTQLDVSWNRVSDWIKDGYIKENTNLELDLSNNRLFAINVCAIRHMKVGYPKLDDNPMICTETCDSRYSNRLCLEPRLNRSEQAIKSPQICKAPPRECINLQPSLTYPDKGLGAGETFRMKVSWTANKSDLMKVDVYNNPTPDSIWIGNYEIHNSKSYRTDINDKFYNQSVISIDTVTTRNNTITLGPYSRLNADIVCITPTSDPSQRQCTLINPPFGPLYGAVSAVQMLTSNWVGVYAFSSVLIYWQGV